MQFSAYTVITSGGDLVITHDQASVGRGEPVLAIANMVADLIAAEIECSVTVRRPLSRYPDERRDDGLGHRVEPVVVTVSVGAEKLTIGSQLGRRTLTVERKEVMRLR